MSQKIDIRERRFNGVDYDTLHPETNINMVLDSSNNSVGGVKGALYGDGNGNIVGASISNPNLLDNPWFTVNQRGATTSAAYEYIADRWLADSTGITWSLGGITIPANAGQAKSIFTVFESELSVGTYTASVLASDGTIYAATAEITNPLVTKTFIRDVFEIDYIGSTKRFRFYNLSNEAKTIRAVKLELGSVSTLANDVAPDYDLELLKCQGYMGGYLNAGSHNAIYRGKNLGTSVTAEQYAAISAGTFDDLYIGDYWVINGVTWRIAAFDYFLHSGDTECTTHHAVIVPDKCLYNAQMNTTNNTTGGYAAVKNRGVLTDAETAINAAFGASHILSHRVYLTNAVANGRPSGGAWFDSTIELMSEAMCYGGTFFEPVSDGSTIPAKYSVDCKQLNLFRHRPDIISNRQTFWLRNVVSAASFAIVANNGGAYCNSASNSNGVRPAFSIKA